MLQISKHKLTSLIKEKATELGFDACGIAEAGKVDSQTRNSFLNWLNKQHHQPMKYMENHLEKRLNPALLVPGAKSVICVAHNYFQQQHQHPDAFYKISRYAAGADYHYVVKEKLYSLLLYLDELTGKTTQSRVFTDSAPVLERYWAQQAGLGAVGKNTCTILPRKGSFFFLGEIITDAELAFDTPFTKDLCGKCTRCMEACPTSAIVAPGKIDASRCISCLTIESKDDIPEIFEGKMQNNIFGCDICQDVCPHNLKFATETQEPAYSSLPALSSWTKQDWESLEKSSWKKNLAKQKSPITRAAFQKLTANIRFAGKTEN